MIFFLFKPFKETPFSRVSHVLCTWYLLHLLVKRDKISWYIKQESLLVAFLEEVSHSFELDSLPLKHTTFILYNTIILFIAYQ